MSLNVPYLFEENFELGTKGAFATETDTGNLLNFQHYTTLSRYDAVVVGPIAPWRGAFCTEINCGDTNDHILITNSQAIATGQIGFSQFMFFIGNDFRATADDVLSIYEVQGVGNAQESVIALRIIAATGAVQLASAQTQADAVTNGVWGAVLPRGKWICVELVTAIVTGSATGTSQIFVDGTAYNTAVTNAAVNTVVARNVLGTQDTLATTLGRLFFDVYKFSSDTANANTTRIGMPHERYPEVVMVTRSTHLALGEAEIVNVTLNPGASTNSRVNIYDTDIADLQDDTNQVAVAGGTTTAGNCVDLAGTPVSVERGVYIQLAGSGGTVAAPNFALVQLGKTHAWNSHGRVRQHGYKRSVVLNPAAQSQ